MDTLGKRHAIITLGAVIALIGLSFLLDPHPTPYPMNGCLSCHAMASTVMHIRDVDNLTAEDWAKWWWQVEERRKR